MKIPGKTIRIGARASKLAVIQAASVKNQLETAHPELKLEIIKITTAGDKDRKTSLAKMGGVGVFIKELENALLSGEIDMAVHSAKDLPSQLPPEFVIAAVPSRESVEDALISSAGLDLSALPPGSKIAAGSPRRRALIHRYRPDLELCDVRGNLDTRLRKLKEEEFDAIVLALAGLKRLNLEHAVSQILPIEEFPPALGQGALAVETLTENNDIRHIAASIDNPPIHKCLRAERSFLRALGAGCSSAVGGFCQAKGKRLIMFAGALDLEGKKFLLAENECSIEDSPEKLGASVAKSLLSQGAGELIQN